MAVKFSKKTKIVATLGPASGTKEIMLEMIKSGVNVFRINFSHAEYEVAAERIRLIREINKEYGYNIAVLADLQGPKLRIGEVEAGAFINPGDSLVFTSDKIVGNSERVYMNYEQFPQDVNPGERVLMDDGKLIVEIVETNKKDTVKAKVIQGGPLKSKKGVNLPNTKISLPALTEKDVKDAKFACEQQVDWIALSFVRHAQDLEDIKNLIKEYSDYKIPVISKIEKPEAIDNLDEIINNTDALMVARGDLGVEVPMEEVPLIQKRIVDAAKLARKPVIIATQMMETMIDSMTPTRAEVNDVANSVLDGADAVMLSGETSVGKYPVEVIKKMSSILRAVELDDSIITPRYKPQKTDQHYITNTTCAQAAKVAQRVNAEAIITLTHSGYTAFQVSSYRAHAHVLCFTDNPRIVCMLNLLWGVRTFLYDSKGETHEDIFKHVKQTAIDYGTVNKGDLTVNLFSMPAFEKGKTNTLIINRI
ncbi:pyruvate kinase [Flavobacteriaceae bacterium UJ101]|nr:pyruvate kinase [Flavobacteriaceae bacterium UJ101]